MNCGMTNEARQAILGSIRTHLAASVPYDQREPLHPINPVKNPAILSKKSSDSLVHSFKTNLISVGAHCTIASDDAGIASALTQIIKSLQQTPLRAQRIAISDAPNVERFLYQSDLEIETLAIAPNASDIFNFDVGITTAQAAIAETGTLVLVSTQERHRLVSLVPPVHIAILDASKIYETLGEALAFIHKTEISPAVTFITGPSRTADIELTLTVGVHGPQELYVIINGLT
jgi:L-lactate dehydrogenase complex protein LldG